MVGHAGALLAFLVGGGGDRSPEMKSEVDVLLSTVFAIHTQHAQRLVIIERGNNI